MTNNPDAQAARQWAEAWAEEPTNHLLAAVYRHILATTTPPTMADIAWDDEVHAGLCAESMDDGVVRMIGPDWVNDHADHILCRLLPGGIDSLPMSSLAPIPGTRVDLTPRREPTTPDHPTFLSSVEDYDDAPVGTVVADDDDDVAMKRDTGRWYWAWKNGAFWAEDLADVDVDPCTVVRWGK